jgi:SAM-dependent methyltransferase
MLNDSSARRRDEIELHYGRRREPTPIPPSIERRIMRERQLASRAMLRDLEPLSGRTLLEIGASRGSNVPWFQSLGFLAGNIVLNEIRPEVAAAADEKWRPLGVRTISGDAGSLDVPPFDVVCAFVVFSTILSDDDRRDVAQACWRLTKRGGGVLIYDMRVSNPNNRDVRKVTPPEIRALFPSTNIRIRRLTLAPPIARRIPESLYRIANRLFLQTHAMYWVAR